MACAALAIGLLSAHSARAANLVYNGGPTLQDQIKVYLIYWLPKGIEFDTTVSGGIGNYETLTQRFYDDVSATPYLNIDAQYTETCASNGNKCALQNLTRAVIPAGAWVDTKTYPHAGTEKDPLQDSDIQNEVTRAIGQEGWAVDANSIFFVLTGVNASNGQMIEECDGSTGCSFTSFCAYHDNYSLNGTKVLYGFLSDASFNPAGCGEGISSGQAPNGQLSSDREVAMMSHEFDETVTDPLLNAWFDSSGNEIGDKCNQIPATVSLGSNKYVVQKLWSNASSSCVSAYGIASEYASVFKYTGKPCSDGGCPGWQELDNNSAAIAYSADEAGLFELHDSGSIFVSDLAACSDGSCTGWSKIAGSPAAVAIAAGGTSFGNGGTALVYALQSNGSIWQYQTILCMPEGICSSWVQLDNNPRVIAISANVIGVYQLQHDGSIWASNGVACSGTSCPGWQRLDDNPAAVGILARGLELYQLHNDGSIWIYTNVPCNGNSCPGWKKLDDNPAATAIAADASGELYELRTDGSIWEYTHEACSGNSCPGWEKLDDNPAAIAITADTRGALYQLHNDGTIWLFTHEACSGNSCPGWEKLDENPLASSITAGGGILIQTHKSL